MRRLVALLAATLLPVPALAGGGLSGGGGGGGVTIGLSSSINAENPSCGRFLITVDDSPMWSLWLADSLAKAAADSGIVDNTWLPRASIGINTGILTDTTDNGLYLFRGQNGCDGCPDIFAPAGVGPEDRCRLSLDEVRRVYDSGLIEICSHTARHKQVDPFTSVSSTVECDYLFGAYDSSTVEFALSDPYRVLRDQLGIYLNTQLEPHHRGSIPEQVILASYYRNARRNGLQNSGTTDFPSAASGGATNPARGNALQLNHNVRDQFTLLFASGDIRARDAWTLTYPGDRLSIPHANNVFVAGHTQANVQSNLDNIKWLIRYAAETKSTVCIVLHDQDNSTPATTPDLYDAGIFPGLTDNGKLGMVGMMDLIRFGMTFVKNGHDGRTGPKLIFSTVDDAMNSRNGIAYLAGPVKMIDNPRLLESGCFPGTPYGIPAAELVAGGVLPDSGWGYVSPDSVLKQGGFSGYNHEDLPTATAADTARACGLFASVIASGNFKPFYLALPCIPRSRAEFSFVWNASHVFRGASSTPDDSLADSRFEVTVVGFMSNMDESDSTTAWVQAGPTALTGEFGPTFASQLVPWSTYGTSNTNGGASLTDANPYCLERAISRAHMRDGSVSLRAETWGSSSYWNAGTNATDTGQRWRQSSLQFFTPPYATGVRLQVTAVGFSAASACTAKIALPELLCQQY